MPVLRRARMASRTTAAPPARRKPFQSPQPGRQHRERPRFDHRPDRQREHAPRPQCRDTPRGALWLPACSRSCGAGQSTRRLRHLADRGGATDAYPASAATWRAPGAGGSRPARPPARRDIAWGAAQRGSAQHPSLQAALGLPGPCWCSTRSPTHSVGAIPFGSGIRCGRGDHPGPQRPGETGALAKAASGATDHPLLRAVHRPHPDRAKAAGIWTVGLTPVAPLCPVRRWATDASPWCSAPRARARAASPATCDEIAGLRMPGKMENLNVSPLPRRSMN